MFDVPHLTDVSPGNKQGVNRVPDNGRRASQALVVVNDIRDISVNGLFFTQQSESLALTRETTVALQDAFKCPGAYPESYLSV